MRTRTSGQPAHLATKRPRAFESAVDSIHKFEIALKEPNESRVWLEMILKRHPVPPKDVEAVLEECVALSKIIAASRWTAAEKAGKTRKA